MNLRTLAAAAGCALVLTTGGFATSAALAGPVPPTPKPYVGDVAGYPKALERYIAGCRPEGDLTFFCVGGPPAFPIHL